MNNQFVIKFHHLYFNKWTSSSFGPNIDSATKYAHPDNAKQDIIDQKLDSECKVYQINFVEVEVK